MRIVICGTPEDAVANAAGQIVTCLRENPTAVLGLATGGTMEPLYARLVAASQASEVDFSGVTTFNLDEYIGLPAEHPASYRTFMQRHLFDPGGFNLSQTHLPNGYAEDLQAECICYERSIAAAGGIDLQLLGIGTDGHIGFNEPGSSLASRTRIKTLARQTLHDNARFFESLDAVPRTAITMGVGTILDSRSILLLAIGSGKSAAVAAAVEGPVTASVAASALQFHPSVTIVVDQAAASGLRFADDYLAAENLRNSTRTTSVS